MNKKILSAIVVMFVTVMVISPMIGIVQAGKGQEKLSFELYVNSVPEIIPERVIKTSPKGSLPPVMGGDAKLVSVEIDYVASALSVTVGSTPYVSSDVELDEGLLNVAVHWNPPMADPQMVIVNDKFTLDFTELFDETAKIEMKRVGKSYLSFTGASGVETSSFVGIGTGLLKGVKVTGIQTGYDGVEGRTYSGTIMGWPDLP